MSASGNGTVAEPTPLPRQWGVGEILMAKENREVALKLVYFTVLMVAFPIGVFFIFHDFLLAGVGVKSRTFFSGMAAVLAANIVIAAYAVVAIREDPVDPGVQRSQARPMKVD